MSQPGAEDPRPALGQDPAPYGPPPFGQPFGQPFPQPGTPPQPPRQQDPPPQLPPQQPAPQQHPFPQPFPQPPPQPPAQQDPRRVPGWVWPVLVATGLVFGLLGGVLGGALVLVTGSEDGAFSGAKPLEADNASVAAVAAKLLPSTVQVRVTGGGEADEPTGASGSGFVLDDEGHVVTNNHVVQGAEGGAGIVVIDVAGRAHEAEVVGRSPVYDIAVLDVARPRGLEPVATGSSQRMQVGETVVAIGSPLGLSSTVTSGIVSALDRPVTTGSGDVSSYINAVQTDAAINPGNSGGPLVNMRGQVVGVNSAIATTGGPVLGGQRGNIGVGFAIPMEQVQVTARQILRTGEAEYPVIGADVQTSTGGAAGATLLRVPAGSPAADAGLERGDRVVAVEGAVVPDAIALIVAIRTHRPGDTIVLTVRRGDRELTVRVRLDAKVG